MITITEAYAKESHFTLNTSNKNRRRVDCSGVRIHLTVLISRENILTPFSRPETTGIRCLLFPDEFITFTPAVCEKPSPALDADVKSSYLVSLCPMIAELHERILYNVYKTTQTAKTPSMASDCWHPTKTWRLFLMKNSAVFHTFRSSQAILILKCRGQHINTEGEKKTERFIQMKSLLGEVHIISV